MRVDSQPFTRESLSELIRFTGRVAAERWPTPTVIMASDIAWQLPGSDPKQNIRLWRRDGEIVAWAWFQPPCAFEFDIDTAPGEDRLTVLDEILAWVFERRQQFPPGSLPYLEYTNMTEWADGIVNPTPVAPDAGKLLTVSVLDSDTALTSALADRGFTATRHYQPFLQHDLEVAHVHIPEGFSIRAILPDDLEAMEAAHKDAWSPSSGFSLDRYRLVREVADCFDPGLHLLAHHESGTVAAHGIFWKDPVSRIGSLEPFGTRPAFRGTGISKALIQAGLRELAATGMIAARIYTAGFNHAARGLYQSCGFRLTDRATTLIRQVPDLPPGG